MAGELAELTRLLTTTAAGSPTVAIIEGPAGSGRTRLLEQLISQARAHGLTTVRETGWVSLAAVRRLERVAPLVLTCDFPRTIDERVWPELNVLARSTAVVLVLTRRAGTELPPLDDLACARVHQIRLAPLTTAEVRVMITRLLGAAPGPELLSLSRVAAGNPASVEDLVIGLREEGLVRTGSGRSDLIQARLPTRIRSRLAGRLTSLSPPARHLLQLAATLAPPFRLVELVELRHSSTAELLPVIDEVLDSGLLVSQGETLAFSHELLRSMVEASIPGSVRAALRDERSRPAVPRTRPPMARQRLDGPDRAWAQLSDRDLQISRLVGRAMTNRQIAHRIGRSPHTVNYHLRRIFQKLGIGSRVELAALAQRHAPTSGGRPADLSSSAGHSSAPRAAQPSGDRAG